MATLASSAQLPALTEPHERDETGRELQAVLVDLVDLSLLGKQLHWAVEGPHFRSLHLQLDDLVDSWRDLSDTVAERAVALGVIPDGQSGAVAAATEITPVARAPIEDRAVVRELTNRIAQASERVRSKLDRIGELDLASQDVLIEVLRELEKQQWMMRAQYGAE
jgi:starvation-inducible DNA-binding protein